MSTDTKPETSTERNEARRSAPSDDQTSHPDHASWRAALYQRFRLRPDPVLAGPSFTIAAASLWAGARSWVAALRSAGASSGERVIVALPRGPAHVEATLAAWWVGLTVCPLDPSALNEGDAQARLLDDLDAALVLGVRPGPMSIVVGEGDIPQAGQRVRARRQRTTCPTTAVWTVEHDTANQPRGTRALTYGALVERLAPRCADGSTPSAMADAPVRVSAGGWHAMGELIDAVWRPLMRGQVVWVDPLPSDVLGDASLPRVTRGAA